MVVVVQGGDNTLRFWRVFRWDLRRITKKNVPSLSSKRFPMKNKIKYQWFMFLGSFCLYRQNADETFREHTESTVLSEISEKIPRLSTMPSSLFCRCAFLTTSVLRNGGGLSPIFLVVILMDRCNDGCMLIFRHSSVGFVVCWWTHNFTSIHRWVSECLQNAAT